MAKVVQLRNTLLKRSSSDVRRSYVEISRILQLQKSQRSTYASQQNQPGSRRRFHASCVAYDGLDDPSSRKILETFKRSFDFPSATHEINQLTGIDAPAGKSIAIHGYLGARKDLSKNLSFVLIKSKDLNHSIQVISSVAPTESRETSAHQQLKLVEANSPVVINGTLRSRVPEKFDAAGTSKSKEFEIHLEKIHCLNGFPKDIIFKDETRFPPEQRHLQLRSDQDARNALGFRARAASVCRDGLSQKGFTEIETPLLFKSTPEGAREYLVPTRRKGWAYALPQSPQQYKQILMASGIPKYYQMAKCFRDEDLRADRQPEFTQLDLEMSFAAGRDVMACVEAIVKRLWGEMLQIDLSLQLFPRLSYEECMLRYGSDKPDIRLGSEILDISHIIPADLVTKITSLSEPVVEAIHMKVSDEPQGTSSFVKSFMESAQAKPFIENQDGGPGIFIVDPRKPLLGLHAFGFEGAQNMEELLKLDEGDLVVIQARKKEPFTGGSTSLGSLRLALHRFAVAQGYITAPQGFNFLWVTEFPLFSTTTSAEPGQGGTAGLCSTHHPFTSPAGAKDIDLLLTDPSKAKAEHYDLVVNGVELGGGSRRIHDARVQEFILKDVLKMPPDRLGEFSHLLEVLRSGCPPHAGIALGFDRLIAVMLGKESVRDVMAFPKTGRGEDPLVKSPSIMSPEALATYHLKVVD